MAGTYDTSDRYQLRALTGSSNVSDIDEGFDFLRDDVSAKLTPYDAGARSSRPRSTPGVPGIAGRTYRSADGGIDLDLGTSWTTVKPGLFTALPTLSGNASDGIDEGMEILYQQVPPLGAIATGPWHLRYDAGLSGSSKWKVIGQPDPLWAEIASITGITNTTYQTLAAGAAGPAVDVIAGIYMISFGAEGSVATTAPTTLVIAPGSTAALAVDADRAARHDPREWGHREFGSHGP